MSLAKDASHIVCDGENCEATVRVPVALHSLLSTPDSRAPTAAGWLCVTTTDCLGLDRTRHFCPRCAARYLSELTSFDAPRAGPARLSHG